MDIIKVIKATLIFMFYKFGLTILIWEISSILFSYLS